MSSMRDNRAHCSSPRWLPSHASHRLAREQSDTGAVKVPRLVFRSIPRLPWRARAMGTVSVKLPCARIWAHGVSSPPLQEVDIFCARYPTIPVSRDERQCKGPAKTAGGDSEGHVFSGEMRLLNR